METTNILTDEIVAEAAEDIVMETGLGTGGKVFLGIVLTTGLVIAGYKTYKHFKNKNENIAVIEAADDDVEAE